MNAGATRAQHTERGKPWQKRSFKHGGTLRMTGSGTLVGMPALERGFDALHPERWSQPPPPGMAPIIPYDDDEPYSGRLPVVLRDETPLPRLPTRRVMPEDERRLLARSAIVGVAMLVAILATTLARLLLT